MIRPCFLVIDREYAGSISTRKLVIETAKLNVITAYSGAEALETLERYPAVNGIVLDAGLRDMACGELVSRLKKLNAGIPIVVIGTPMGAHCEGGDHFLESFEPAKLLSLLSRIVPGIAAITREEEALAREQR